MPLNGNISLPWDDLGVQVLASNDEKHDLDGQSGVATAHKMKTKLPKRYKVLIHNDDYTTMEFVVFVLQSVFKRSLEDAQGIMLKVHKEGVGICGVYTHEVAETKTIQVNKLAKESGHPLRCTYEEE